MLDRSHYMPTEQDEAPEVERERERQACNKLLDLMHQYHPAGDPYAETKPKAQPIKVLAPIHNQQLVLAHELCSGEKLFPDDGHITVADIQRAVCVHYGVTKAELVSHRRTAKVIRPRQVAMHLCRTLTSRSYPDIGARFGGRDHTSVLFAVNRMNTRLPHEPELAEEVALLTAKLTGAAA